jgi:hypothetical protein
MVTEINRIDAIRLFDKHIYPHIIGDLKLLDIIQPKTHGNGCSIPTAMLILSSLDFIGYLLRPTGSLDDSEDNITAALKHKDYFPDTYTTDVIKNLVIIYRHGIMHSFYPRQTATKIYGIHKSDNLLLIENIVCEGHNITSLNVNVLSNNFKAFVDKLYQEVLITSNTVVLQNILKGFKLVYPEYLATTSTTTDQTTIPYGVNSKK